MQMFLFNIARAMMGTSSSISTGNTNLDSAWTKIFEPVIKVLDTLLVPLLIIIGTAGSIYAIVLGVNYSKAETADKREEAKKRMINAVIGMVIMLILLILLKLFTANAATVAQWITGIGSSTSST